MAMGRRFNNAGLDAGKPVNGFSSEEDTCSGSKPTDGTDPSGAISVGVGGRGVSVGKKRGVGAAAE